MSATFKALVEETRQVCVSYLQYPPANAVAHSTKPFADVFKKVVDACQLPVALGNQRCVHAAAAGQACGAFQSTSHTCRVARTRWCAVKRNLS
jgi:Na+-translocating ferredoxin:NAD+ oxidoreductase RNF subunit RnfB